MITEQKVKQLIQQELARAQAMDGLRVAWPVISGGELAKRLHRLEQDITNNSVTVNFLIAFEGELRVYAIPATFIETITL